MKSIYVIGNFSSRGKFIGGQHIRSDNIYNLVLKKYSDYNINKIDTAFRGFSFYLIIISLILGKDKLIILPGERLLSFFIIVCMLNPFSFKRIVCVAIGGWMPTFFTKHSILKYIAMYWVRIFVQIPSMKSEMSSIGFKNVETLPNFRLDFRIPSHSKNNVVRRLVFISRICSEKGVFDLIDCLNDIDTSYVCDFYGPIEPSIKDIFLEKLSKNPNLKYAGELSNFDVVDRLSSYDLFIFPTKYNGEGFPGVILESLYAGTYILASDWNYNSEIINEYGGGEVYKDGTLKIRLMKLIGNEVPIYKEFDSISLENEVNRIFSVD